MKSAVFKPYSQMIADGVNTPWWLHTARVYFLHVKTKDSSELKVAKNVRLSPTMVEPKKTLWTSMMAL